MTLPSRASRGQLTPAMLGITPRISSNTAVAAASQFPPQGVFRTQFTLERTPQTGETLPSALVTVATPSYFETLRVPIRRGRAFAASDNLGAPRVAIVNEAFAAQGLAVTRDLGLADDDERVNPNGGAIAMGHPLGMSGARLVATANYELARRAGRYALCTMCIGVGQGIALIIERV